MATLTIKNLPDEIYAALTEKARLNRRSINGEAIVTLENSLQTASNKEKQLERIRQLRESLPNEIWLTDEMLAESRTELIRRSSWVLDSAQPKQKQAGKKKAKNLK